MEQTLGTARMRKGLVHFSWGLVFEFGRSAAADLGGSYKISL